MDLFDIVISGKIRKEGGGDVSVDALSVAENGVYTASSGHAYSPVTVAVPQPSGTLSITSNGVFDVGSFASADVNVSGGGGGISIDDIAMRSISGVVSASVNEVRAYAFNNCVDITEANFPNAVNIASSVFNGCTKISKVNIPNVNTIYANAFHGCASLKTITLPKTSWIGSSAFRFCSKLESIYLLSTAVVSLTATNVFQYTPISASSYIGHFGSIYVPASLVDEYKSKANWSAYSDRITAIPEE